MIEADLTAVMKPEKIQMEVFLGSSVQDAIGRLPHKMTIEVVVSSPQIEVKDKSTATDHGSKNTTSIPAESSGAVSNQSSSLSNASNSNSTNTNTTQTIATITGTPEKTIESPWTEQASDVNTSISK